MTDFERYANLSGKRESGTITVNKTSKFKMQNCINRTLTSFCSNYLPATSL